jgi:multimeric flavodoxin WrbA
MIHRDERLRVVGIGGTLREGSTCLGALRRALEAAEEVGAETRLLNLRELVVEMAAGSSQGARGAEALGAAV